MDEAAAFKIEDGGAGKRALLTGDWTATHLGLTADRLVSELGGAKDVTLDLTGIGRCDTSGAWSVLRATDEKAESDKIIATPELKKLLGNGAEGDGGRTDAGGRPVGPGPRCSSASAAASSMSASTCSTPWFSTVTCWWPSDG